MTKILVIEDAKDLREDMLEMLTIEGYQAVGAENGVLGLAMTRTHKPDLIICDVMMPELDGYGVLEAVRKDKDIATTPFIFLTSRTERVNIRHGMVLGADDYLTKPFLVAELLEAIRSQLRKRAELNEIVNLRLSELRENITTALPHELRTPLNTILGFSDMLISEAQRLKPDQVVDWASHINTAANRLYRMTENYLAYARISIASDSHEARESYLRERTSGIAMLAEAQMMRVADRHKRAQDYVLDVDDADELHFGYSDLQKVLEELFDNAFKFSAKGTSVQVIGHVVAGVYRLDVLDRGRGISPEQAQNIGAYMQFERWFYEQQGVGLGLAIVAQLVKLHDGEFKVEPRHDSDGTRATLWLKVG